MANEPIAAPNIDPSTARETHSVESERVAGSAPRSDAADRHPATALIEAGAAFHHRGWSLATSSNYSVLLGRSPLRLLVTVSGRHKDRLTTGDFVAVDRQGNPLAAGSGKSSAETLLHCLIYELETAAECVLHTHSVWGNVLSDHFFQLGHIEFPAYEMKKGLPGVQSHDETVRIGIVENSQDIPALAADVRRQRECRSLAFRHGFLIRRHGLYTWGETVDDARRHVETLEFLMECLGRELMLARRT